MKSDKNTLIGFVLGIIAFLIISHSFVSDYIESFFSGMDPVKQLLAMAVILLAIFLLIDRLD